MFQVLIKVSFEKFQLQKKRHGLCKSYSWKKEEKVLKKWTSVRDIENNGYLDARLKKKMNKICFKEHSRIRITTIYIFHTHAHLDLRVWHFSPWILVLTLQYIQCKNVCMIHPYLSSTKAFRSKQKEGKIIIALVRIQKYHIYGVI